MRRYLHENALYEDSFHEESARSLLQWSPLFLPTVEGLMRHEAGNLLDSLVTWLPQLRLHAEFEAAGAARAEEQLALLVRSFHACGA